ncbi:cytochrome P450 [Mycena sanguinolenta]|nr:cytochrome P450 [Mycena sanguinolenta]
MHSLALLALAVVALRVFYRVFRAWQRRHLPFPPGPPPYALIGNFFDLPTKLPWLTYTKWGIQHGDLVHASTLGQHIVVVNSVQTAVELFEKRSHIYSDRPVVPMVELMGWDFSLGLLPRGDKWRAYRRMFHQHFRQDVLQTYHPIQMKKIHLLLQGLVSSPEEFREHLKTLAGAIIMETVYGYEVQATNDRFVAISESAVSKLSDSVFPGSVAVNTIPILRYLPSWMPGTGFQRFAAECRHLTKEMQEVPFNFAKQNMRDGVDSTSVVARLLEANRYDEVAIQAVAGVAYAGGTDTKKAQTEIYTVVGSNRLPEFEDRASLPYVEALYREVLRWKPVAPIGMAHASTEDDIYNGYFIPKDMLIAWLGTAVIGNIWAMTRDQSIYHEPERFDPDRFFTVDGKLKEDNTMLAFGCGLAHVQKIQLVTNVLFSFGRRICPGRHIANATVWTTIVSVLSAFNIAKAKDVTGKEIAIDPKYSDGMISHPGPFVCSITPRPETAKTLVQATTETRDF